MNRYRGGLRDLFRQWDRYLREQEKLRRETLMRS
jgi:hypothetical protein